jgi:formate hydrogenlyase subunit 6/NADH:ubiquinone oxidoreductase subunit I
VAYVIDRGACFSCGWCAEGCPTDAIGERFGGSVSYAVDIEWCIDCGICAQLCPLACFSYRPELQPESAQLELAKQRARDFAAR